MRLLVFSLVLLLQSFARGETTGFSLITFNIRYGTANDKLDAWPLRQHRTLKLIKENPADFVCLQEALRFQLDSIAKDLPQHAETAAGRDDGTTKGEHCAIFHRADRWILASSGTFWLSETPEVIGSKGWGAGLPRICTWGRYVSRADGKAVWVANVHLDHESEKARREAVRLVAKRMAARPFPGDPVIITGDFNASDTSNPFNYLSGKLKDEPCALPLRDAFRVANPDENPVGTFHSFTGKTDNARIDHIFSSPELKVLKSSIIRTAYEGRYPSDHFAVSAGFGW